ncbi:MAG: SprB repeat-containing protein, partial [Bacteroidetes bacterium]|nr:SprB repeat-containing protein [Bacteroidota bacterium]
MKRLLHTIVLVLLSYITANACTYTLECLDSWGDGWNGGYIDIWINGSYQGQFYASGIGTNYSITVNTGDQLQMSYTAGSYEDENTWNLYNAGGAWIDGGGPYPSSGFPVTYTADCGASGPSTAGDCSDAINVCTDLGFQIDANGFGSINEIPALGSYGNPDNNNPGGSGNWGCLRIGESNSTWMIVNIGSDGNLQFNFGGSSQAGYYDWIMYPYNENSCTDIPNNLVAPVRCNWNAVSYGGTGCATTVPIGGDPGNFEPALPVLCGEQYIICFSNYSSAITNVPLSFFGTASVSCLELNCAGSANCNVTPVTGPEQDCMNAIPVCQNYYCQENTYTGTGSIPNEIDAGPSCLGSGEKNDVWYTFTVIQSGNISFTIFPNDGSDDYDWAVYDLTNADCSDIYTDPSLEVSCNYSANIGCDGTTGANGDVNCAGQNEAVIPVVANETYVLNVSNYTSSNSGYELDFSASTAIIFDDIPPAILSLTSIPGCGATQIGFNFTEYILCSSIQDCDFTLTGPGGPYTLSGVTGAGCAAGGTQENTFTINVSPAISASGSYNLNLVGGCGYVEDLCGNVAGPGSLPFTITNITATTSTSNPQCFGGNTGSASINASGGITPYTYNWTNGSVINTASNLTAGSYGVTVTD